MRAVIALLLTMAWSAAVAHAGPEKFVVSYLISAGPDSNAWTAMEGVPIAAPPPHRWEWRVYDPSTGTDRLFLALPAFPLGIRWDSTFTEVYFAMDGTIRRARWAFGEKSRVIARLPVDSTYCDFWLDRSGVWHVYAQKESLVTANGMATSRQTGTRWDLEPSGRWNAAAVDSESGGHDGECEMTPRLEPSAPRVPAIRVDALLADMRLNPDRAVPATHREFDAPPEAEDWIWIRSSKDPLVGLEMGGGTGDTYHAFEPVVWVDRYRKLRKRVRTRGVAPSGDGAQIAFGERNGRVLIVSEFEGASPTVLDMDTGKILLQVTRPSARAVWVHAPR